MPGGKPVLSAATVGKESNPESHSKMELKHCGLAGNGEKIHSFTFVCQQMSLPWGMPFLPADGSDNGAGSASKLMRIPPPSDLSEEHLILMIFLADTH